MRAQQQHARQWRLLAEISKTQRGLTIAQLMTLTEQSRPNLYRDLDVLEQAGLPISRERGRVRLLTLKELPPAGFSALQIAALHLARLQLGPLAGADAVRELDALLAKLRPNDAQGVFQFGGSVRSVAPPQVLKTIERAQRYRRRAAIEYRAASRGGTPARVHIEPLIFNVADGEPYVLAYCVERKGERTYKLARIANAELTNDPATYKPSRSPKEAFAHSIKAWSGAPQVVRIRLDAEVAWLAREYPLPHQKETAKPDGSVIIEAQVAGLVEARRWILSWGGAAEALDPPELREATKAELSKALRKYDGPGPVKAARGARGKSTEVAEQRLKDRETRAG
jgi:predicted DNA-binding transcriptional regulator YafY